MVVEFLLGFFNWIILVMVWGLEIIENFDNKCYIDKFVFEFKVYCKYFMRFEKVCLYWYSEKCDVYCIVCVFYMI